MASYSLKGLSIGAQVLGICLLLLCWIIIPASNPDVIGSSELVGKIENQDLEKGEEIKVTGQIQDEDDDFIIDSVYVNVYFQFFPHTEFEGSEDLDEGDFVLVEGSISDHGYDERYSSSEDKIIRKPNAYINVTKVTKLPTSNGYLTNGYLTFTLYLIGFLSFLGGCILRGQHFEKKMLTEGSPLTISDSDSYYHYQTKVGRLRTMKSLFYVFGIIICSPLLVFAIISNVTDFPLTSIPVMLAVGSGILFFLFFQMINVGFYLKNRGAVIERALVDYNAMRPVTQSTHTLTTINQPPPPCSHCNTGMVYVDQYQKWYCNRCNLYQ